MWSDSARGANGRCAWGADKRSPSTTLAPFTLQIRPPDVNGVSLNAHNLE